MANLQTFKIDWLSVSTPVDVEPRNTLPRDWAYTGKGRHGYRHAFSSKGSGTALQIEGSVAGQGSHWQASGDALNALRQSRSDEDIVAYFVAAEWKCTRIDIALDVRDDARITPVILSKWLSAGALKPPSRTHNLTVGSGVSGVIGSTLYIGSRSSETFVRVYDKAAEQGWDVGDGSVWTRIELELKADTAQRAMLAIDQNGLREVAVAHFRRALGDMPQILDEIIGQSTVSLERGSRPETNTERWLMGTVASSLAKTIRLNPDFKEKFDNAVKAEIELLFAIGDDL